MSMMEHECADCGWLGFDNNERGPVRCPRCESDRIYSYADEEPEYEYEEVEE